MAGQSAEPAGSAPLITTSVNAQSPSADPGFAELDFSGQSSRRLTHQLFRFPAKFHAPVVGQLIERFTAPGDFIVDPFCGSGTLLVEASVRGRNAIGFDVDPLSVFLARTKSQALDVSEFERTACELDAALEPLARPPGEYRRRMHVDLTDEEYETQLAGLDPPAIPRLFHWFRRYVIVDLCRIRQVIDATECSPEIKAAIRLVFASSLRGASNADPVPVSGLERTKHMLRRDEAGRLVDPFALIRRKLSRAATDLADYQGARDPASKCEALVADATEPLPVPADEVVAAAITSPPYHGAVDYYRRHQLEMFWLGLTGSQDERLVLLDKYLGRPHVPQRHRFVLHTDLGLWPTVAANEDAIRSRAPRRADEFRHYCVGMSRSFAQLADALPKAAPAIFVVGHSQWNGTELDTSQLFEELAAPMFTLDEKLSYPVKNRHMSYGRHNGANIDREYVLVFHRA